MAFQQIALKVVDTSHASTLDKLWLDTEHGEERINLLPREVRLELASIWVEACDKGEWEHFANHPASCPSDHSLHQMSTQFQVALLQAETPTVESDEARAYARLRDDQVAGLFIQNVNFTSALVFFDLQTA
jgi:hypothetical protein